ncbi:MAG: bifunctional methylenetetrahydrofolate dehydrogenase/methenyltetrahydrofolate cyclohydrolase, partial [Phycisphaerae bacterium]|nr:bifunctional methylenetetrahydrofolate dehydrogenase/methenyltetrahydrofolate cyclohydrolase [Phycisphaerae bacterium]
MVTARGGSVALDAVIVDAGDNASRVYAANQARGCEALGISYRLHELPAGSSES